MATRKRVTKKVEDKSEQILEKAKAKGIEDDYFFQTTFERYKFQLKLLAGLQEDIMASGGRDKASRGSLFGAYSGDISRGSTYGDRIAKAVIDMPSRAGRWKYIRKLAWNRDSSVKAVCWICGEPIDYTVCPSTTPDSYEPDHIIPVAKDASKELDLNNIRASHRRCNRGRGDGTNGTNTIGRRSRVWSR